MTVIFQDENGYKLYNNVTNIRKLENSVWELLYDNDEVEEVNKELLEIADENL